MAKKEKKIEAVDERYMKHQQPLAGEYDDSVFDLLEGGDVEDDTLPINIIIPDETQPRRIIPNEFAHDLRGGIVSAIEAWEEYVLDTVDDFPILEILQGKASVEDYVNDDVIVMGFAKLVSLAANIRDIGLNHAIGVVKRGDVYRIVYGERRWTAFQFLNHYLGGFERIPTKVAQVTEWQLAKAQAAENFQTDPLNAIGKARQFAKLLIIARTDGGDKYDSWNAMVAPGGCDRPWYAQVANGDIHRIPRGLGSQFEQAMNVSVGQMRQYRNLLKLYDNHNLSHQVNNALWSLGDAGNWAEGFMRDVGQYLQVDEVDEILNGTKGYTVTIVTVSRTEEALREAVAAAQRAAELAKKQAERDTIPTVKTPPQPSPNSEREQVDKSTWASYQWVGREAWAGNIEGFVTDCTKPETVVFSYEKNGKIEEGEIHISALFDHAPGDGDNADTPSGDTVYLDKNGVAIKEGDTVLTKRGIEASVIGFNRRYVEVESDNKFLAKGHYPEWLEVVQAKIPHPSPTTQVEGAEDKLDKFQSGTRVILMHPYGQHKKGEVGTVKEWTGKKSVLFDGHKFMTVKAANEVRHVLHYCIPYEEEDDEATQATPPQPSPNSERESVAEKSGYPVMAGKSLLYGDEVVYGVADEGEYMLIQYADKRQESVEKLRLSFNTEQRSPEHLMDPTPSPSPKHQEGESGKLVFAGNDIVRRYLEPYLALSELLNDENATAAIEWLLRLTDDRTNHQQLDAAMTHVIGHIESINERVERVVSERFQLVMDEYEMLKE